MTIDELIAQVRAALAARLEARNAHTQTIEAIRATCLSAQTDPSDEQAEQVRTAQAAQATIDTEVTQLRERLAGFETEKARDEAAAALSREFQPAAPRPGYENQARTGAEPRTYTAETSRDVNFLGDVYGQFRGDNRAAQRLGRHMDEERVERGHLLQRDVGSGAFAGLTVPQYLTDLVAPAVAAGRPLADVCRKMTLPAEGMTVNISRITTGTAVAVQATEYAGVQETDIDDTLLTVNVRTISGQQDVSAQALDRSTGAEHVVLEDLALRYATYLDSQIINADGTSGTHLGVRSTTSIQSVTYTDATPTVAEAWGPLFDLQQKIESGFFHSATHLVMHPRRWAFFASGIGTTFPFMQQAAAPSWVGGTNPANEGKGYSGVRGVLAGLPVLVDGNIPLTVGGGAEDVILGVTAPELFLWEQPGSPLYIRAEQPGAGNLAVKFVIYGYSAFTAGRYPGAHGLITGTGLTTPTYGIAAS